MLTLLCALTSLVTVHATYSIVATDSKTRQVGGAGATCLDDTDVFEALYVSVPNRTVLHTQGLLLPRDSPILLAARDKMANASADSLDGILNTMKELDEDIWNPEFWPGEGIPTVGLRQYGIANFASSRGYTGGNLTGVYAELFDDFDTEEYDVGGSVTTSSGHSMIYHALGNVVSDGTVNLLKTGFLVSSSDDLAERLMAAMRFVLMGQGGDLRCLNRDGTSTTASGAYLHVDNADGTEYLHLNIIGDYRTEPVEKLEKEFDEWKASSASSAVPYCFSVDTTVELSSGASKKMKELQIGDSVLVAPNHYEAIYGFGHFDASSSKVEFLRIRTTAGKSLELTPNHLVFLAGKPVPAASLNVGDELKIADEVDIVQSIQIIWKQGAVAPYTASGTIVTNGIQSSCFATVDNTDNGKIVLGRYELPFITYHDLGLIFESPRRVLCHFSKNACKRLETYNDQGMSKWVDLPLQWYNSLILEQSHFIGIPIFGMTFLVYGFFNILEMLVMNPVSVLLTLTFTALFLRNSSSSSRTRKSLD